LKRRLGQFLHALGRCQRASEMIPARVGTLQTWRQNPSSVRRDASTARWGGIVPNFTAPQRALEGFSACWKQRSACCRRSSTRWREFKTRKKDPNFCKAAASVWLQP
jgi:hypothetical protein